MGDLNPVPGLPFSADRPRFAWKNKPCSIHSPCCTTAACEAPPCPRSLIQTSFVGFTHCAGPMFSTQLPFYPRFATASRAALYPKKTHLSDVDRGTQPRQEIAPLSHTAGTCLCVVLHSIPRPLTPASRNIVLRKPYATGRGAVFDEHHPTPSCFVKPVWWA